MCFTFSDTVLGPQRGAPALNSDRGERCRSITRLVVQHRRNNPPSPWTPARESAASAATVRRWYTSDQGATDGDSAAYPTNIGLRTPHDWPEINRTNAAGCFMYFHGDVSGPDYELFSFFLPPEGVILLFFLPPSPHKLSCPPHSKRNTMSFRRINSPLGLHFYHSDTKSDHTLL